MAYMGDLTFRIEENPPWRVQQRTSTSGHGDKGRSESVASSLTSTEMLEAISSRVEEYKSLPEKALTFCTTAFPRGMAVEYVHHSNIGESVGTQGFEDTQTLLELVLNKAKADVAVISSDGTPSNKEGRQLRDWSRSELESVNTCKALKKFDEDVRGEMKGTGMVTVQQLCDVHQVLLDGLHTSNGKLRDGDVFTQTEDGNHFYPEAERAKQQLYALIDHHNIRMDYYKNELQKAEVATKQKVGFLVRCAARLLFEFVDTHPFSDGNGRMCRLLASYVISLITPFPVAVYHSPNHSKRSHRHGYISAIVKCRKNPQDGPRDLAAMVLEGIYLGWESLFRNLTALKLLDPREQLGPIVVKKSDMQSLETKLRRLFSRESSIENVVDKVRHAIISEDVSSLTPLLEYRRVHVDVDEERRVYISVDVYP